MSTQYDICCPALSPQLNSCYMIRLSQPDTCCLAVITSAWFFLSDHDTSTWLMLPGLCRGVGERSWWMTFCHLMKMTSCCSRLPPYPMSCGPCCWPRHSSRWLLWSKYISCMFCVLCVCACVWKRDKDRRRERERETDHKRLNLDLISECDTRCFCTSSYSGGNPGMEFGDITIIHCLTGWLPEAIPLQWVL